MVKGFVKAGLRRIYARIDGQFVPIGWVRQDEITPNAEYIVYKTSREVKE
jgi:hypothetical protein